MASRKLPMSVKDCLEWVKDKQKSLRGRDYDKNYLGIQQALQRHRETSAEIKEFSEVIDKQKRTKSRDSKQLQENYKLLEDLDLQKKRCLESMLYVTETESLFQNLEAEVEDRALYLRDRKVVFDSVYRTPDLELSARIHRDCVYAQRESWDWLSQVSTCLHTHIQNAARYHQFFHDVQFLDRDMAQFVFWINSGALSRITEDVSADNLIRIIREMTSHLLDYQSRSERLKEESGEIYPIHKRRDTPQQPIKVKALVNYKNDEMCLEENQTYLLVDNSDSEIWKVLNKNDTESEVPSIVLVIPPPDGEAVNNSLRLREQVKVHYEIAVDTLRPHLRRFMTQFMDEREAREFERLDDKQRNDIMNLANLAMRLLVAEDGNGDQEEFTEALATVRKFLSQFKGDNRRYADKDAFLQWKSAEKVLITFQELMTYGEVFTEEVAAREDHYVDNDLLSIYASKAYFERAKPVELECATTSDFVTKGEITAELYIYERNREQGSTKNRDRLKSDEIQQKLQKTLNAQLANGIGETSQETKMFVVKGVFDPRNGERISLDEALARKIINKAHGTFTNPDTFETMSISQAINLGLIDVAVGEAAMNGDVSHDGVDFLHGTSEVRTCPILGVVDPRSGKAISVDEAIASGILDPETGMYYNTVTREQISLKEALKKGLVILDARFADGVANEDAIFSLDSSQRSYKVQGVIDPRSGQKLTFRRAMMSGIIDTEKGVYCNPETGEEIPLAEAMQRGLITADEVPPGTVGESILTFNELHLRTEKVLAAEPELTAEKNDAVDAVYNLNELVYNKLLESTEPTLKGIKDPLGQYDLSIAEAYNLGILRLDTAEYDRLDGDVIPLQEAAARGLINPELLKELLHLYSENSIGELVRKGILDPDTGLVTDPNTGISCSLQSAILQDLIKPETTFFFDVPSQKITSLSTAIEDQVFNVENAKYRKSPKEFVSLAEANQSHLIQYDIDPDKITEHACALAQLRPLINTEQKGVYSPYKQENVSIEEAIMTDVLNLPQGKYVDEVAREQMPLIAAVKSDKISPETAMDLFGALDKLSIQQAINENRLDPKTGLWCVEAGHQSMPLEEAAFADPSFVFYVDNATGDVTNLSTAIAKGKFEPHTGKFRDNASGQVFTIEEAIDNDIINPRVDPGTCLNVTSNLKDLIDSGKINPRTTSFVAPNGETMSLREAMANGFLTMNSDVKLDPATGCIVLASDEDVVQSLLEIKEITDWLNSVEETLASEQKPNEKPEVLKTQLESCKELEADIQSHEPSVASSINKARTILNKSKFEKRADDNQQHQKLKQNITDVGVRFDAAKVEVNTRSETIQDMTEELDMFYDQSVKFEDSIEDFRDRSRELQRSRAGVETQHKEFRELLDGIKDKEVDLTELVKAVTRFQEGSLDFQKACNNYRKQLHMSPAKPPRASGTSALEDELENAEAKYREVSKDVAKFTDTLGTIASEKKQLEELEDKLDRFYPKVEEALKQVSPANASRNPDQAAKNIDNLKSAHAGLVSQSKTLADLGDVADKLAEALGEMNKINEAAEIKKQFKDYQNKHKNLYAAVESKQAELTNALSQSQDVSNRLGDLLSWISDAEGKVRHAKPISLSMDKLNEQIQEQRLLNADISAHKGVIGRVAKETGEGPGSARKVEEIRSKMDKLEKSAAQRTKDLEEVATSVTELQGSATKLDAWLIESVRSLQDKMKTGDRHVVKSKVDELYHEKRNREDSMQVLKGLGSKLVEDHRVCDVHAPKEVIAGVQTKWHELTELLVQQVSLEALTEIDGMLKYLDKAENEINTAEPISVEPDILTVQLRDHHAFNEDLHEKRNAVKEIINKCNRMLRETTNEQTDEIKNRLDSIRTQADIVCQLSDDRLHQLEAAVPLASHFSENHGELSAWLDEMEAELQAQGGAGDDIDQIKKQLDNLKGTQQIIEDHKPFVEDLNATGLEMMEICGDEDSADVQGQLYGINIRYEELKTSARMKADVLSDARKNISNEVVDNIDSLLDDMCQFKGQVLAADPIPSNPEKLKDEIEENNIILGQAKKRQPYIEKATESLKSIKNQEIDEDADLEDLESKLKEVKELSASIEADCGARDKALNDAMIVSDKFYDVLTDVTTALRDLKDNILSQEPPGVDPPTVREQIKELEEFKIELVKCKGMVADCKKIGGQLDKMCGSTGKIEVKKQLEDLDVLLDDVEDINNDREEELSKGLQTSEKFQNSMDSIMSWLPISEHKLSSMSTPSGDLNKLVKQREELQLFKNQIHPHVVDLEALNQQLASLRDTSPMAAESIQRPVQDLNERWNDLVGGISQREAALNDMEIRVGQIDGAIDEVCNGLEQADMGAQEIQETYADPKCLETRLKRLQLIQRDVHNLEDLSKKLNKGVDTLERQTGNEHPAMRQKLGHMNELVKTAQVNSLGKQNQLQEALREVKKFVGSIEDLLQWVNELRMDLKSPAPLGALPDTAKRQSDAFQKQFEDMLNKEDSVGELVAKGQTILDRCNPEDVSHMSDKLRKLKERWQDTKDRAYKRKSKLEEHSKNVSEFHRTLKGFTEWLTNSEITLKGFVYPSKLVDRVVKQIETHQNFKAEVIKQKEIMEKLDRTGTYLKYFGRKQDTIYIKNLLVGIRLRWKKLLRRVDERGRYLKQAHKEDKRFYDAWKGLCDWLDQSERKMTRIISQAQSPNKVNQDMDDVKEINVQDNGTKRHLHVSGRKQLKVFQQQLNSKHQDFYSATRLGRNLKDRCTKTDPEKEVLQGMLDDLKNKWNFVRTVVSKSQNKLDEALLNSGRVSDALSSLLEWLQRTEETLGERQPVLGDVDTVHILIEQHRGLQQELVARESTIASMKASGELRNNELLELDTIWDRVNNLSEARESRLQTSLRLAEEFQEVVQIMREFLPQAEGELKVKGLPEDEMAIIQLIERHEKFQEELRSHQDHVDKIKELAEDILRNCHPNAVRFVKYYLTITQTRWDQIMARAKSREERLHDALRSIQGNAALLEELLSWLTDAQVLLATKERDPIPEDLRVVEELVTEHLEFHDDITSKNADVDRLTKVVSSEFAKYSQGRNYGSNWKLNEIDTHNPRVNALQNKWRTVWRMSVDRKKRLQDSLEQLLELESFKNFDFDLWRQRYINWIAAKKLRITDFFRRQDKDCDGALTREEFVFGMLQAKFPTNRTELNAVFDIFDSNNTGYIEYKEFIEALRPEKHRRGQRSKKPKTQSELIHDDIERNVSHCQCRRQFRAEKLDEGKYKFGENQIKLVRFLNTTVMVRVGGGWVTLVQFLEQNDPCRAKGRTNIDLRDTLNLPDGNSSGRSTPRRYGAPQRSSTPSSIRSAKKHTTDTGYASSNSSAGSSGNLSTSRKNKTTLSMINLSEVNNSTPRRKTEFGSTNDLNRSRRLSDSSSSIASGVGRSTRSTKSPAPSSRPKTPNYQSPRSSAASPSPRTSTPNRPTTPSSGKPGGRRSRPTTPVQHHYGWR